VEVKRIIRKRTRMHVTVGRATTLSPDGSAIRPYHSRRLRLNARLLAAVKHSSTITNRFCSSDHGSELMHKNNHKLRIGIVGAGNIVRTRHLPALKKKLRRGNCRRFKLHIRKLGTLLREIRCGATDPGWAEWFATPDIDIV